MRTTSKHFFTQLAKKIEKGLKAFERHWFLVVIVIIALFLRLYNANFDLSLDECTVTAEVLNVDGAGHPAYDQPPLDKYLIAASAKVFGLKELALRLPSILFSVLAVVAAFFLGKLAYNRKTGFIFAFLMAISYPFIYYAKSARPYSLFSLILILSTYFLIKALKKRRNWIFYTLLSITGVYTHYFYVFVIAFQIALVVLVVLFEKKDALAKWTGAVTSRKALAKRVLTPLAISLAITALATGMLLYHYVNFRLTHPDITRTHVYSFSLPAIWGHFSYVFLSGWLWWLYPVLFLMGLYFLARKSKMLAAGFAFWIVGAVCLLYAINAHYGNYFNFRFFFAAFPLFLLAAAGGLGTLFEMIRRRLPYRKLANTVLILILIVLLAFGSAGTFAFLRKPAHRPWEKVTEYLRDSAKPSLIDSVVVIPGYELVCVKLYSWQMITPAFDHHKFFRVDGPASQKEINLENLKRHTDTFNNDIFRGRQRQVYIIKTPDAYLKFDREALDSYLEDNFELLRRFRGGVELYRLITNEDTARALGEKFLYLRLTRRLVGVTILMSLWYVDVKYILPVLENLL